MNIMSCHLNNFGELHVFLRTFSNVWSKIEFPKRGNLCLSKSNSSGSWLYFRNSNIAKISYSRKSLFCIFNIVEIIRMSHLVPDIRVWCSRMRSSYKSVQPHSLWRIFGKTVDLLISDLTRTQRNHWFARQQFSGSE